MFGYLENKQSPMEGIPIIPGGTWYAGHLHMMKEADFSKSIYQFSVEHANEEGRCTFYMGPTTPSLSVTRYEDVQTLLKASSHRELFPVMGWHMEKFFGRYNLAVLTGTEWKSKRSTVVKALHGKHVLQHNQGAFRRAAETLAESLQNVEFVEDVSVLFKMLTLDAFGLATLHHDFGCCRELQPSQLMKDFEYMSSEVMRRVSKDILNPASHLYALPTQANKRHQQAMERMATCIHDIIKQRRVLMESNENVPQDLLTALIVENEKAFGNENEEQVSEQMLADTIKSLLFAGYETSSVTLTYVLYLLSQHPKVEQCCLEEIQAQPDQLVYVEAVIKEAMRLYPPVISTTRSLERDVLLDGILVPKGMYLYFPIWVIQRDERHFWRPLDFIPERWAARLDGKRWKPREFPEQDDDKGVPAGNPQAFVAFSAGARSCAGQRFAVQEMATALSVLLPKFKLEPPQDHVLTLHREGFVQCPKGGIPMKIFKRTTAN